MATIDHNQAVSDVAAALKQVLSVSPQLLYEASVSLGSELAIESMRVELSGESARQVDRLRYRVSVCLMLSRLLVQSGRASLTNSDVAAMSMYMQLRRDDTKT